MTTQFTCFAKPTLSTFGLMVGLWLLVSCSPPAGGKGEGGGADGVPEGFTLAAKVDPHVAALGDQLMAKGGRAELLSWSGRTLVPEDYVGVLRSSAGVLAGYAGNDVDRCRFLAELLSVDGIPTRFAMDGNACAVEAWVDDAVEHVSTSMFDDDAIPEAWVRSTSISPATFHRIEILERLREADAAAEGVLEHENALGSWTLAELATAPVILDYVENAGTVALRLRAGRAGEHTERLGGDLTDIERQELVIRYTRPVQDPVEYTRILFDRTSRLKNQSPDEGRDIYAVWFGGNVVGEAYLQGESVLAGEKEDGAELGDALYLRAIELAMETDNAAWQVFDKGELDGGYSYDRARIVIAAQERRFDGHEGVTPSFDLLANARRILASSDPVAARFALGYSDAMVEGAVLERTTGAVGLTVPNIFASLYRDEADDVVSRAEWYEDALRRLEQEGVTEEGLVFSDEATGSRVEIVVVGTDLLLTSDAANADRLELLAGDRFSELTRAIDGVVLADGSDRTWPIDLLLLDQGAALNFTPRITHFESPQLALATASGTYLQGSATYLGQSMRLHAVTREFEELAVPSDPNSKRDLADWHLFDNAAGLVGSGSKADDTPTLDQKNPRILQWGEAPSTVSFYESPLWVAPAVAAGIRAKQPTDCRITTDTGGAADWVGVTFDRFSEGRTTLEVDGQPVGVQTIIATTETLSHEIVLARTGLTRLILGLRTPNGASTIESIVTPRAVRLRGRVMSHRKTQAGTDEPAYSVGVRDAGVRSGGLLGTSWPDGSIDLRVADSAQPTLTGSIGILVDTSNSMDQPVVSGCASDCATKIETVSSALAEIVQDADEGIELAVWGFPSTFDGSCNVDARALADWSLARTATDASRNFLTSARLTGGTPLTGAVRGALNEMSDRALGVSRRLIVLADGDNDCDAGLSSVKVPSGIDIHTIGVGLVAGSDAELQLMDLASRGGGTYTRTTNGDDLSDTLTMIAALPITPPVTDVVATEIEAESYTPITFDFPADEDDVVVYLDAAPDRDVPGFVVAMPDEPLPTALDAIDAETRTLIEERRARRPGITFVMPDRLVSTGGWIDVYGWLEIDAVTGETTAVTADGLHGAGGVIYFGATVVGLWAGAEAVISNFSDCVMLPDGCGGNIDEIRHTICRTAGYGPALGAIAVSWIGTVFTGANGFALDESYAAGLAVVNKLCSTEFDLTGFVASTRDNAISDNLGEVPGGWVGFGYSVMVTIWANSGGTD